MTVEELNERAMTVQSPIEALRVIEDIRRFREEHPGEGVFLPRAVETLMKRFGPKFDEFATAKALPSQLPQKGPFDDLE